ncbi:hypothetical protein [Peterkaempfera sp. SMS 1(5)a]|uniref:hypothetical protein n=1 Tax=Peterkaempfera podocarpi TaxID=3232308 RepID=UPI00366F3AD6
MGVGYMLLYAAFVVVALWLVAELLLQNKAPLVWRALALAGFLGVVAGMQLGSVAIIGLGAAAFAVGQTFVTLSVKRGYDAGWSLRRPDGSLPGPLERIPLLAGAGGESELDEAYVEPVGEVGPVEGYEETYPDEPAEEPHLAMAADPQQVYEMQPLHEDDSDGYGVYTGATATQQGYYDAAAYGGYQQQDPYAAAYQGGYDQTQYTAAAYQGYYDAAAYQQQQDPYAAAYQGGYDQTQYTQGWDPAQQQTGYTDWSQQQPQAYGDYTAQQHPDTWQPSA